VKLPHNIRFVEDKLRLLTSGKISRGKLEISVSVVNLTAKETAVAPNKAVIAEYLSALGEVKKEFNLEDDLRLSFAMRIPEAFQVQHTEADEEQIWEDIKSVAETALEKFTTARAEEGARLKADIEKKLENLETMTLQIEKLEPECRSKYV